MPSTPLMTARWQDLLLLTWAVPDDLLRPHLSEGVELDRQDGHALASVVAFDFADIRLYGVRWPGYTDFPELNLRFYVRRGESRGVVFIREFVPSRVVATMARAMYNEPYRRVPYRKAGRAHVLACGGRTHRVAWDPAGPLTEPAPDSRAHWLKERAFGVGRSRSGQTRWYRVTHPVWRVWPDARVDLDVDFAALYGPAWAFLNATPPWSTVAAEGSAVEVYPHEPLDGDAPGSGR